MTPDWYLEWAERHATAFAFAPTYSAALIEWGVVWAERYTAAELTAATDRLIASRAKLEPWDHRTAVPDAVDAVRKEARLAAADTAGDWSEAVGVCVDCGDSGRASVVHPMYGPDGRTLRAELSREPHKVVRVPLPGGGEARREWWYRLAVVCRCAAGRRIVEQWRLCAARFDPYPPEPLTLGAYAARYPDWRAVRAMADAAQQATESAGRAASDPATAADLARRVADGMRAH